MILDPSAGDSLNEKIIIGLLLLGAVVSLFQRLFFLVKDGSVTTAYRESPDLKNWVCIALFGCSGDVATGQLHLNPTPHP